MLLLILILLSTKHDIKTYTIYSTANSIGNDIVQLLIMPLIVFGFKVWYLSANNNSTANIIDSGIVLILIMLSSVSNFSGK